jgi:hypothetical protein
VIFQTLVGSRFTWTTTGTFLMTLATFGLRLNRKRAGLSNATYSAKTSGSPSIFPVVCWKISKSFYIECFALGRRGSCCRQAGRIGEPNGALRDGMAGER